MAKGKSMVHKLNKETKKEHFPNWDANNSGGKGDGKRTSTPETRKAFKSGFDGIDWSKK
tara:strand:+ start:142 stop:318 length:177 start_codon:yes stop_codon:yes gene_type:complete